ncbi:MAG: UvrD-helicase domain-containing protein [Candidatus Cryptobacteroides sp.]
MGTKNIQIYRASAGSGKTFTLTKDYLKLLFADGDIHSYRHILAVTFTNKATEEMKNRIIEELAVLAGKVKDGNGESRKSPYADELKLMHGWSDGRLKEEAGKRLLCLMHDYPAFAVSTIDKFFQLTLKAFARECGKTPSYQVELRKDAVVEESVDMLLDSLYLEKSGDAEKDRENELLLNWLSSNVLDKISKGEKYKPDAYLTEKAKRLETPQRETAMKEYCASHPDFNPDVYFSHNELVKLQQACDSFMVDFENRVLAAAERLLREFNRCGVSPDITFMKDLLESYGSLVHTEKGLEFEPNFFHGDKLAAADGKFAKKVNDGVEKWFGKGQELPPLPADNRLVGEALALRALFDGEEYKKYCTVNIVHSQIYSIGLTDRLRRYYEQIMADNNVLCIDDSNKLLHDIIDESDAPFVYEKLGVRYNHYLLDEFQDTARIQWDNFRPLIAENTSYGGQNLIVGDEKQSIYRFRDSDWGLLQSKVKEDMEALHRTVGEASLDTNFRSLSSVVGFNNDFFTAAASIVDLIDYGETKNVVSGLYTNVAQKVSPKAAESVCRGRVELSFTPASRRKDLGMLYQCQRIYDIIRDLQEHGSARLSDIAVLVRYNREGEKVATFLSGHGVNVITNDSMYVKSSSLVNKLSMLLGHIDNKNDAVCLFVAQEVVDVYKEMHPLEVAEYESIMREKTGAEAYRLTLLDILPLSYTSLIELAEQLFALLKTQMEPGQWQGETLYIQAFMDAIKDYVGNYGNCLHDFLRYWADYNPSISSAQSDNAVQIVTVHKSKGLAFPYVILPFVDNLSLSDYRDEKWCALEQSVELRDGIRLEGVYDVKLTSSLENTYFASALASETKLTHIDNLNILYVALTRAQKGLHIVASMPSATFLKFFCENVDEVRNLSTPGGYQKYSKKGPVEGVFESPKDKIKDFGTIFYWFAKWRMANDYDTSSEEYIESKKFDLLSAEISEKDFLDCAAKSYEILKSSLKDGECIEDYFKFDIEHYVFGERPFAAEPSDAFGFSHRADASNADMLQLDDPLPTIPLNPAVTPLQAGLGGVTRRKMKARGRLKLTEESLDFFRTLDAESTSARQRGIDLHESLAAVRFAEDIDDDFIRKAATRHPDWIPSESDDAKVYNEVDYIFNGRVLRPDRVVEYADRVIVLDYKFGGYYPSYERQVRDYMMMWRSLRPEKKVEGYLWYINASKDDGLLEEKLDGGDYIEVKI